MNHFFVITELMVKAGVGGRGMGRAKGGVGVRRRGGYCTAGKGYCTPYKATSHDMSIIGLLHTRHCIAICHAGIND